MRVQITLTVPEAKRLIAKGIAGRRDVREALANRKIFLKGGTTVSAICDELCGQSLTISGRVTPKGTKTSKELALVWHNVFIEKGQLRNIEGGVREVVKEFGKGDVVILGANAFDNHGNAGLLMGRAFGGEVGPALIGMMGEVRNVIIAVGTEKLVPGNLMEVIRLAGRSEVDLAMGMAVGLMPAVGEIYTEVDALKTLARVHPQIVGRGGVSGAEGATTIFADGEESEVRRVFDLVQSLKGTHESARGGSLEECEPGEKCKFHSACVYRKKRSVPSRRL